MSNIKLQPPLRRGITADKDRNIIWINNWEDMRRCRSQKFGENLVSFYKDIGLAGHNGEDYILLQGEDIYASHDGTVIEVSDDATAGIGVYIMSLDKSYRTVYWHMKVGSIIVSVGQDVKAGDKIGQGDNTGRSTASHLHWGIKLYSNGILLNYDNGFWGSVDPELFTINKTMKLIRKQGDKKVWAIIENKRFWILDSDTLNRGVSIWGGWSGVAEGDPYQYGYGGALFISSTDDPLL